MPTTLKNEAAIVGIGETEYSKNSGRSELALASEACATAIRDAGLTPADIDGWVKAQQGRAGSGNDASRPMAKGLRSRNSAN